MQHTYFAQIKNKKKQRKKSLPIFRALFVIASPFIVWVCALCNLLKRITKCRCKWFWFKLLLFDHAIEWEKNWICWQLGENERERQTIQTYTVFAGKIVCEFFFIQTKWRKKNIINNNVETIKRTSHPIIVSVSRFSDTIESVCTLSCVFRVYIFFVFMCNVLAHHWIERIEMSHRIWFASYRHIIVVSISRWALFTVLFFSSFLCYCSIRFPMIWERIQLVWTFKSVKISPRIIVCKQLKTLSKCNFVWLMWCA